MNVLDGDTTTDYHPSELFLGQQIAVDSGYQAPRSVRLGLKLEL